MEPTSDEYEDVAHVYIQAIKKDSPNAAAALEKIHITAGWRATLRAGLILSLLKTEIQQHRYMPNLSLYVYLFDEYPQELPLLEQAIDDCLHVWHLQDVDVSLKNGNAPFYPSERLLATL